MSFFVFVNSFFYEIKAQDIFTSMLGKLDKKLSSLEDEKKQLFELLETLPEPIPGQKGERWGYFSREAYGNDDHPQGHIIKIDLLKNARIEGVAIFPTRAEENGQSLLGYGFPLQFMVEISNQSDFSQSAIIANYTNQDFSNPGHYPLFIDVPNLEAKYLRMNILKCPVRNKKYELSLSEIMVFENGINICEGLTSIIVTRSVETAPYWARFNLTDGQTDLGAPQIKQVTPGEGTVGSRHKNADHQIWFQMNLSNPMMLHKVKLIPIYPAGVSLAGHRFPREFMILSSTTEDFRDPEVLFDTGNSIFHNPGGNPAIIHFPPTHTKYLRLHIKKLIGIDTQNDAGYNSGIAEFEAYAMSGNNVALEAHFTTNSPQENKAWAINNINDGFASRGKRVPLLPWVKQLDQRRRALVGLEEIQGKMIKRHQYYGSILKWGFVFLLIVSMVFVFFMIYRSRLLRRLEVETLKTQLSNDLHDGLGSDLSNISLLSQLLKKGSLFDEKVQKDIDNIYKSSERMMSTLKDIVLFLHPGQNNQAIVPHMKNMADSLLQDCSLDWKMNHPEIFENLPPNIKYAIFMIYKEALNNIYKHAKAHNVAVVLSCSPTNIELEIGDDGIGFDKQLKSKGLGLSSMKLRARKIGADLDFLESSDYTTLLKIKLPIQ